MSVAIEKSNCSCCGFERTFHATYLLVHLADGGIDGNVHAAQATFDKSLGFGFVDQRAVGGHVDLDAQ